MVTKRILLAMCCVIIAGVGGCNSPMSSYGPSSPAPMPVTTPNTIIISGMAFNPPSITISKGTLLTWKNSDPLTHTSTSDTGVWATGDIAPGTSKAVTFGTPGTYTYHCSHHPMMTGTVIVQ